MNNCIKTVLFGNQKQSLRQNIAVVNFIEDFLVTEDKQCVLNTEEQVCQAIERKIDFLCSLTSLTGWLDSEKLFLQYILGMEGWDAISHDIPGKVERHAVGKTGKVVFTYCPSDVHDYWPVPTEEVRSAALAAKKVNDSWACEEKREAASKEDEAWALVEKIVNSVPPARREQVPEDDALAAVMLSQEYWRVND